MVMTTVEDFFPTRRSEVLSHLGSWARARPVLKVVSSLPMSVRVYEVGMPCTSNCAEGVSRWTVVVPGIRWRIWEILLLSEVACTVSMVVKSRSLDELHYTRWM